MINVAEIQSVEQVAALLVCATIGAVGVYYMGYLHGNTNGYRQGSDSGDRAGHARGKSEGFNLGLIRGKRAGRLSLGAELMEVIGEQDGPMDACKAVLKVIRRAGDEDD